MDTDPTIRDPDELRRSCAGKLCRVEVSPHFTAILGCLLGEDWASPRLLEMTVTPDGAVLGRCEGQPGYGTFLGAEPDLLRNVRGVAAVAELDGDEVGYLLGRVAGLKRPG